MKVWTREPSRHNILTVLAVLVFQSSSAALPLDQSHYWKMRLVSSDTIRSVGRAQLAGRHAFIARADFVIDIRLFRFALICCQWPIGLKFSSLASILINIPTVSHRRFYNCMPSDIAIRLILNKCAEQFSHVVASQSVVVRELQFLRKKICVGKWWNARWKRSMATVSIQSIDAWRRALMRDARPQHRADEVRIDIDQIDWRVQPYRICTLHSRSTQIVSTTDNVHTSRNNEPFEM